MRCVLSFLKSAIRTVFFFGMVCLIFSISAQSAYSSQVTLAWDANNENNLAGYIVYYGTRSGYYANSIDVGNTTQYTISNLQAGVTYYIAVSAYNTDDYESDYSQELVYTLPDSESTSPNLVFEPSDSTNSPLSGHYILTFDVTGITGQIAEATIRLFFENPHDRITIYCDNNLITTLNNVAAMQWYDIALQDVITENKLYIVIVSYDPYKQLIQEQNQAELIVALQ